MARGQSRKGTPAGRPGDRRPKQSPAGSAFDHALDRHLRWLFPAILAAMVLTVFGDYLSFRSLYLFKDIGSDTLNNFYPQRVLAADYLRRYGLPGWSFNQGLGQNVFPNSLGDPFAWILYALGPKRLAYWIAPVEVLKIFVSGFLFYGLLRLRRIPAFAAAIAALCYSFCATLIVGGGWWYFLSDQVVHAAFLLVAYELVLRRRAAWSFAVAVALTCSFSAFNPYPLGVLLLVYALARAFADGEPEARAIPGHALRVLGLAVVGFAISAVFWLPSAREMLLSPRVGGHSGLFSELLKAPALRLGDVKLYATEILRSFGADLLGTGGSYRGWQNYLEAPLHYCGLAALLLAPQFLVLAERRRRIVYGVVGGLLLLAYVFPWFRHAFWLFSGDYFRTLSLCVSIALLLASAHALDAVLKGRALDLRLLAATLAVLLMLLHLPYSNGRTSLAADPGPRGLVTLFLAVYAVLLAALARRGFRGPAQVGLLLLVPIELATFAQAPVNQRPNLSAVEWEDRIGYRDHTLEALDLIRRQDHGFYRVEKNYFSSPAAGGSLNDGMVQGYYGTSSYYSFNPLDYIGFLGGLGVIDPSDPVQTNWAPGLRSRFVLQTLASVRYWLYRGDYTQTPMLAGTYRPLAKVGDIQILRNEHFVPLGFGLRETIRQSAFSRLDATSRDVTLLRAVVVPDSVADRLSRFVRFDPASIRLPYLLTTYMDDAQRCAAGAMSVGIANPNHIEGRLESAAASIRVFSFPFDPGWTATVDGRPTRLERVDCGLTGLVVEAGTHVIRLDYEPPLRRVGSLISAAGLLALVAVTVIPRLGRGRARPGVT